MNEEQKQAAQERTELRFSDKFQKEEIDRIEPLIEKVLRYDRRTLQRVVYLIQKAGVDCGYRNWNQCPYATPYSINLACDIAELEKRVKG